MQGVGVQERRGGGNWDLRARGRLRAYERPPAIDDMRSHRGGSDPPAFVLSTPRAGHEQRAGAASAPSGCTGHLCRSLAAQKRVQAGWDTCQAASRPRLLPRLSCCRHAARSAGMLLPPHSGYCCVGRHI